MVDQPIRDVQEFLVAVRAGSAAKKIVVAESVLRNGDGIVLAADGAVVIELRDPGGVVEAGVVCLFGEEHVIFAEFRGTRVRIFRRRFVPEGEMAFAAQKIGADDATVIFEAWQTGPEAEIARSISRYRERNIRARLRITK